jgi:starch phosphorylase
VKEKAGKRAVWTPSDVVMAQAYDTPVPGWQASWTNTLRLWSAKPKKIFDLDPFNRGDFMRGRRARSAGRDDFAGSLSR